MEVQFQRHYANNLRVKFPLLRFFSGSHSESLRTEETLHGGFTITKSTVDAAELCRVQKQSIVQSSALQTQKLLKCRGHISQGSCFTFLTVTTPGSKLYITHL